MSRAPLTDDLIARLLAAATRRTEGYDVEGELMNEAAEALAAASRPPQEVTDERSVRGGILDRGRTVAHGEGHVSGESPAIPAGHRVVVPLDDYTPDEALQVAEGPSTLRDLVADYFVRAARINELERAGASPAAPPPWQPIEAPFVDEVLEAALTEYRAAIRARVYPGECYSILDGQARERRAALATNELLRAAADYPPDLALPSPPASAPQRPDENER